MRHEAVPILSLPTSNTIILSCVPCLYSGLILSMSSVIICMLAESMRKSHPVLVRGVLRNSSNVDAAEGSVFVKLIQGRRLRQVGSKALPGRCVPDQISASTANIALMLPWLLWTGKMAKRHLCCFHPASLLEECYGVAVGEAPGRNNLVIITYIL